MSGEQTPVPVPGWAPLLDRIAAEVQVVEPGFTVCGQLRSSPPPTRVAHLTNVIYRRYYHRQDHLGSTGGLEDGTGLFSVPAEVRDSPVGDAELSHAIVEAFSSVFHWDPSWSATASSDRVRRGDVVLRVGPEEVQHRGETLLVRFPTVRPWASPGFFVVGSPAGAPRSDGRLVRTYVNLLPAEAPATFVGVVADLQSQGLQFAAKIARGLRWNRRPDSAVVYADVSDLPEVVATVLDRDPDLFQEPVPAFTRAVARGVALADEPHCAEPLSFGQHRCRLLANALEAAGVGASPTVRRRALDDGLLAAGLDLQRLHLNPGAPELPLIGAGT